MKQPADTLPPAAEASMARAQFLQLAEAALGQLGSALPPLDATDLLQRRLGIRVDVDAIGFGLLHDDEHAIDRLMLIECALGAMPSENASEARRRLLVLNRDLSSVSITGFSLDPARGVLLNRSCAMPHETPATLIERIAGLVDIAAAWRHDAFADLSAARQLLNTRFAA
ncbi:MAG: hypothetical protein EOO22_08200 [Comamonadaceae bacterium]|nr:MAG: hypothetical protein EOO22_08200 [Comamonadaceae bacterium]